MLNKNKYNILLVIDTLTGGGAELVVSNLSKYINKDKFNVHVCCLKDMGERAEELKKRDYDVTLLQTRKNGLGKYLSPIHLAKLIKNKCINLVHSHSTQGLVDCGIVKLTNRRLRHVHTFHFGNYPQLDEKSLFLERLFKNIPDQLIAVGEEQNIAIRKTFSLDKNHIKTIWNGIEILQNETESEVKNVFERQDDRIIICSISTLIEQKGITYLLDAISLLSKRRKNFVLWIVGDGPLRKELKEKAAVLRLDGLVEFIGWVRDAPVRVLPKIDIFIQPSLWEAMSMVVLEAMAAGKAVIVTDVGDNRHVIESGRNGIIVEKKNINDMADRLEELIVNEVLRRELGMKAKQRVLRDCSVDEMAKKHERLYKEILCAKR